MPQPRRDALGPAGVLGPDRAREPVDRVVGERDGGVLPRVAVRAGESLDGQHGTEGLLLHAGHARGAVVEDRREVVEAAGERRVLRSPAAAAQRRSLGEAGRDVRLHLLPVRGRDERAGLGVGVERAAEANVLRPADQLLDDLVVDAVLDHEPRAGRADLSGVQEDRREGVVDRGVEVGVGEDDVGVLAAELERHALHRGRRGRHDAPAGDDPAGEGDEVDLGSLGEGRADAVTGAQHEVGDPVGQAGVGERPHEPRRRRRGELARLEHEGVAGRERRGDLPGGLQERVVPRRDQRADADRLVDHPAGHGRDAGVDDPPGVGLGQRGEVPEHPHDVVDVDLRLDEPLAGVEGLQPGDLVLLGLEPIGHPVQQGGALR